MLVGVWGCVVTCGADDVICIVWSWISENELLTGTILEEVSERWTGSSGFLGFVGDLLRDYGQLLVGFMGVSFGVWKWLTYRETILHKRLAEYLDEQDGRLLHARNDLLQAIERPGPGRAYADPIFSDSRLRAVLRERRWDFSTFGGQIVRSVNGDIDKALEHIENRIETAEAVLKSFREQRSTAHLIKGAVAAAESKNALTGAAAIERDSSALIHFRTAMQVPGHARDTYAKEFEAHQLRRLGKLDEAETAYLELESFANDIAQRKQRELIKARSMSYRASILQTRALVNFYENDNGVNGGALSAHNLLNNAFDLYAMHAPFKDWELLEFGRFQFLRALVCNRLQFGAAEQARLSDADQAITLLLGQSDKVFTRNRSLRRAAKSEKSRIRSATVSGEYDLDWLLPPHL